MIDSFSLLLTHGLVLLACWRLVKRNDLDDESADHAGQDLVGRPDPVAKQPQSLRDA
jgi:hypothetical protein